MSLIDDYCDYDDDDDDDDGLSEMCCNIVNSSSDTSSSCLSLCLSVCLLVCLCMFLSMICSSCHIYTLQNVFCCTVINAVVCSNSLNHTHTLVRPLPVT